MLGALAVRPAAAGAVVGIFAEKGERVGIFAPASGADAARIPAYARISRR
jgi:hypothetical protein